MLFQLFGTNSATYSRLDNDIPMASGVSHLDAVGKKTKLI